MPGATTSGRLAAAAAGLLIGVAAGGAGPAAAQAEYDWHDQLPEGSVLRVFSVHGEITVTSAEGRVARVRGRGRASSRGGYDLVFQADRVRDGALVCVLYREGSSCDEDGIRSRGSRDQRGRVDLAVELPRGVELRVSTGNGDVAVRGATADVNAASGNGEVRVGPGAVRVRASSGNGEVTVDGARGRVDASSGNGGVRVSTEAGPVNASTGNGTIDVRMASLREGGDMEFTSGNGSIVLELPADVSARLLATTGHGDFDVDFPIELRGRIGRNRIEGVIGDGDRSLRISTGNGSIRLRPAGR